jgi:hypothetical protein
MYTLYTRVYDLWYRGSDLPISPYWDAMNFNDDLVENPELVCAFSNISLLEQKFCKFSVLYFNPIENKQFDRIDEQYR